MSIRWLSEVWNNGPENPLERYVLLKLADNANDDGYCFPSLDEICAKTKLSSSTVRRFIKALERDGWIEVNRGRGAGHRSQYQLLGKRSEGKLSHRKVSHEKVSDRSEKGVTQTKKGIRQTNPPHPLIGVTVTNRQEPSAEVDSYLGIWNEMCGTLPKVSKLTKERRKKLKTRIAEGLTPQAFRQLVVTCANTPFLRGDSKGGWRADFDWLIENEANVLKVREGKYGPPPSSSTTVSNSVRYRDPASVYDGPEYAIERRLA
jgi:DNA-binding transcriptional regulator YhcF (GntR family)